MNYTDVFGDETISPSPSSFTSISLTSDISVYWPDNYTGTGYVISSINDVSSSGSFSITLPPANQVSNGRDFVLRNRGFDPIEVLKNDGTSAASLAAGVSKFFYVTDNSTAAGTWGVFTLGTGTSSADASELQGYGVKAIGATLNQSRSVEVITTNTTVSAVHRAKVLVSESGSLTVTLPSSASIGNDFFFSVSNNGTGSLTIDPYSSETIDNLSSIVLNQNESAEVHCSGSEWYTIGRGRNTSFNFTQLTKDVSAGGTITLTPSEYANKLMTFEGSPSDNVIIIIPAVVQVYYIFNNVATGKSVTLKTASGAGVTISESNRVIVFCDSVDTYSAQTEYTSTFVSDTQTPTDAQTLFTLPFEYVIGSGKLEIYLNGLREFNATETSNTTVTFPEGLLTTDSVVFIYRS